MKKIISKILIIFIVLIILFEFVLSSNICNAIDIDEDFINNVTNLAGGVVSIIYWPKRITAVGLSFAIDLLTAQLAKTSGTNTDSTLFGANNLIITPFDIFFNKYKLLDVNFFDIDGVDSDTITYTFRTTVANWFYVMRLISAIILMVILIYIGIRMALSTIADDKAKYKKMLFDWVCSLILIFVLQYIAIFTIYCNNAIVAALKSTITDISTENNISNILISIGLKGVAGIGITSIASVLVFVFIVFQTIAFLIAYINRMIKVGFLIIISPLISLTYSIDKIGDGKAQALGTWLKEFIYTILIQPFHCIMYMAFVRPALSLLITPATVFGISIPLFESSDYNQLVNAVLAILCLKFINDGEKVVRKIFGFQDDNGLTSMAGGMAVGMMAVKNAKKIGATTRKGFNTVRNTSSKFAKGFSKDVEKFKKSDNKILKGLGTAGSAAETVAGKASGAIGGALSKASNAVNNNKFIRGAKSIPGKLKDASGEKGAKGFLARQTLRANSFMRKHNSLASTLGMMGAAMAYSTGSTDALTAIGTGKAIKDGTQELFASSDNSLASGEVENDLKEDEKEQEALESEIKELGNDIKGDEEAIADKAGFDKYKQSMEEADKQDKIAEQEEEKARKQQQQADAAKQKGRKEQAERYAEAARKRAAAAREKAEKIRTAAEQDGHDGRFAKMLSGGNDALGTKEKEKQLEEKIKEKENFGSIEAIKARIQNRRSSPSKSELQAKKNEIVAKLTALKLSDSGDNKQERTLTVSETDSIERTAQTLIENIEHGVLVGNGITEKGNFPSNYIKSKLDLSNSFEDNENYQGLFKATSEYETLQRRKQKVETYSQQSKYGGDPDRLVALEAQKVKDRRKDN